MTFSLEQLLGTSTKLEEWQVAQEHIPTLEQVGLDILDFPNPAVRSLEIEPVCKNVEVNIIRYLLNVVAEQEGGFLGEPEKAAFTVETRKLQGFQKKDLPPVMAQVIQKHEGEETFLILDGPYIGCIGHQFDGQDSITVMRAFNPYSLWVRRDLVAQSINRSMRLFFPETRHQLHEIVQDTSHEDWIFELLQFLILKATGGAFVAFPRMRQVMEAYHSRFRHTKQ